MTIERAKVVCVHLLGALLMASPVWAECGNDCPDDCWSYRTGPAIQAAVTPNPLKICRQAQNPTGSSQWSGEQWFTYFHGLGANITYSDDDEGQRHWYVPDFADLDPLCDFWCLGSANFPGNAHGCDCTCICREYVDPWITVGGGSLTVTWTKSGTIDLTTPGSYTLTAHICNDNAPGGCNGWAKDACITRTLTIQVSQYCGCEDSSGTISDWIYITPQGVCRPGENWTDPAIVDSCGNTLQVSCSGAYHLKYNGSDQGICIWPYGINDFAYKTQATPCGWVFYAIFHRTQDTDAALPSFKDCGTIGKYDWQDTYYEPCLVGPPAPQSCCSGSSNPGQGPGGGCPSPGDCINVNQCWHSP